MQNSHAKAPGTITGLIDDAMLAGPLQCWMQCANAMAETSLALAVQASKTTMSMLGDGEVEATAAEPAPTRAALPVRSSAEQTSGSWYRAPYRSPFDPMFWLEPEPAQQTTPAMLWARQLQAAPMAAASAMPFGFPMFPAAASAMPSPFAVMQPLFAAWPSMLAAGLAPSAFGMSSPFASMMSGGPFGALGGNFMPAQMFGGLAPFAPSMTQTWPPMLAPWLSMMKGMQAAQAVQTPAMLDPSAAYSAYRSAGGYAVAQAFMATAVKPAQSMTAPMTMWTNLMFPWLQH